MNQVSDQWLQMVDDVLAAAVENTSLQNFDRSCRMAPTKAGLTYLDRQRVAEELIKENAVKIEDGRLSIVDPSECEDLYRAACVGDTRVWRILETLGFEESFERKFSAQRLKEIGDIGENFVLELLRQNLPKEMHHQIIHVARNNDLAGYDIMAPRISDLELLSLLEVKTSVRVASKFSCFVSLNEIQVGLRNPNWNLVGVLVRNGVPELLGHIPISSICENLPINQDEKAVWQSVKLQFERDDFQLGLP